MENTSILVYLLKSTVAFTALYGMYILLFRKNQQFAVSRFYLVFTIVFASLFPFIKIITYKTVEIPAFETAVADATGVGQQIITNQPDISFWNQLNVSDLTLFLYLIISSFILVRLLYMLIRFGVNLFNHSRVERLYGKRVIVSDYWNQTFSFFGFIVLPQKDFQLKENQLLIEHELVHVRQYHTLDLLLAELFQVLHWFNPFAHLIKKDMREVHEFLADFNVVKGGASKYAYQQLLLNYLASSVTPRVANSFSAKLLKKRFAMMTTNKTPKSVLIKYTLAIPVIAVLIGLMSFQTKINYTYSTDKIDDKIEIDEGMSPSINVNNFTISKSIAKEETKTKTKPNRSNESSKTEEISNKIELLNKINIAQLKIRGIEHVDIKKSEDLKSKLLRIINANNSTYLKDFAISTGSIPIILKQGITYRFYVVWSDDNRTSDNGFILTRENKEKIVDVIQPIKTFKSKDFSHFDYFCETTGVYKMEMSNYAADYKYAVGLCLLSVDDSHAKKHKKVEIVEINSMGKQDTSKKDYFVVVEEMPKFENKAPEAAREYIAKNTQYPKIAKDNGIEGNVYVNFVVESNGKVSNVRVVRAVDPILDKEAIRVIESMPDWTPGKQRGKNVPVQFTFPIVFKLAEKQQNIETEEVVLTAQRGDKPEPFVIVEEMPKFDNKDLEAAKEYIKKNIKYPEIAAKNGIQGTVFVSFVVEPDGAVSEVKIERGVDPIIDKEALRVIESMPKWIPGYQREQAVRVKFTLPVIFKLDNKK